MDWKNTRVEVYTTRFHYTVLAATSYILFGVTSHLAILASILFNYVGSPPSTQVILGQSILIKDRLALGFCVCAVWP